MERHIIYHWELSHTIQRAQAVLKEAKIQLQTPPLHSKIKTLVDEMVINQKQLEQAFVALVEVIDTQQQLFLNDPVNVRSISRQLSNAILTQFRYDVLIRQMIGWFASRLQQATLPHSPISTVKAPDVRRMELYRASYRQTVMHLDWLVKLSRVVGYQPQPEQPDYATLDELLQKLWQLDTQFQEANTGLCQAYVRRLTQHRRLKDLLAKLNHRRSVTD